MSAFVEGSPAAKKWHEVKTFKDKGLDEARALDIPMLAEEDSLLGALEVLDDPECYRSTAIPKAGAVIRRAVNEIGQAKKHLRESVISDLNDYRRSFEKNYDLASISEDARATFVRIFENAEASIEAEEGVYALKAFMDRFKQGNGANIIALLTPSAEQGSAPSPAGGSDPASEPAGSAPNELQTVQLRSISAKAYGKPVIETPQDVEAYVSALKDELLAQVSSGRIVMR